MNGQPGKHREAVARLGSDWPTTRHAGGLEPLLGTSDHSHRASFEPAVELGERWSLKPKPGFSTAWAGTVPRSKFATGSGLPVRRGPPSRREVAAHYGRSLVDDGANEQARHYWNRD